MMSTCVQPPADHCMGEGEGRESVYSPASSYSTYSHEVKYIFDPVEESADEFADYSQITPRAKQNFLSHTPRTLSAASQLSGKENQTPRTPREDVFDPPRAMLSPRTNSVVSSGSRDRCALSPYAEEAVYSATHQAYGQQHRRQNSLAAASPRERVYFSPARDMPPVPPYPYAKHPYPAWKNDNVNHSNSSNAGCMRNNAMNAGNAPMAHLPPGGHKPSTFHPDYPKQHNRSFGAGTGASTFKPQYPFVNMHSNSTHYQHPYGQPPLSQGPHQGQHMLPEPPYPMPPRYNHQQHMRRKTWSPPALKMSLLNAAPQSARVCYSNDSLDCTDDQGIERKISLSLSDDLDATPPRLAPISGVLAQKPGPNLIKPIAFKPVNASGKGSPSVQTSRQGPGGADSRLGASPDMPRPHAVKLGTSMLGLRGSPDAHNNNKPIPGAFNSTAKLQSSQNPTSQHHQMAPSHQSHSTDNVPHVPHHPSSVHSSHNSSQLNSSSASHHSVSASSYCNIPASTHHNSSANSSHQSAADEASFSTEFQRPSDRPDSVPSLNTSRVSSHTVEGMLQTPSPSDSGVGELEAMVREKDAEINTLREVMDRNERAIFQVYEERRNVWLQDSQEMRDEYERKLKIQSRKSYKTEQVLSLQVYKLQQEQKTLQEENVKLAEERDLLKQKLQENQIQFSDIKTEQNSNLESPVANGAERKSSTSERLREDEKEGSPATQEELALKNKELITLKSQLQSFENDMEKKTKEVVDKVRELSSKNDQIKSLKEELLRLRDPPVLAESSCQTHVPSEVSVSENMKPSMLGERDKTITGLQDELMEIRTQVTLLKEEHEKEREQWLDEKNKVVRYQKQLQLNYVQMQRKNQTLETEVQQLTLELENRDMKLIALSGEESVC